MKTPEEPTKLFCPTSQSEWRAWLAQNHQQEDFVWLVYYRAATGKASISWSVAVDEALCFGWIDSTKRKIDEERYMQYFTKRKPRSTWSKINKEKVQQLIDSGLMTEAGYRSIEMAKENGSWSILDEVEALIVPEDLDKALRSQPAALDFFNSQSKSRKKIMLHWVVFAKRPETRKKRISEIVRSAAKGERPKQFR